MKRNYRKLLTFLLAFSMILSMHVSFAVQGGGNEDLDEPYEFLAKFELKGNSWKSEGSSNGVTVTGSAIEVHFESEEPIFAVVIKGSNTSVTEYFDGVYSGSFDNSGLKNPGDQTPEISNISFYTMGIEPPPELGEIEIKKIVVDEEGAIIAKDDTDFTFKIEMKVDGKWVEIDESTVTLTGNDSKKLTGLPLGEYRITEEEPNEGYFLDDDTENPQFATLDSDGDEESVIFTNVREDDTPPPPDMGSLKVHKRIDYPDGRVAANIKDGKFELTLTGPLGEDDSKERIETIDGNGEHAVFNNLPFGTYLLEETDIDHEGYSYDGMPRFQIYGNQNPADVSYGSVEIKIDSKGQIQYWVINVLDDNPQLGEIEISKTLLDHMEQEVTDNDTLFEFKVEMKVAEGEGFIWEEIDDSPVFLKGGESETITGLPLGEYRITEKDPPSGYNLVSSNGLIRSLDNDGDSKKASFTNMMDEFPPVLGEIEISKALVDEEGEEITDDNTNFTFKIEIKVANDDEGFDWVVIDESPISLKGGEFEKLTDLPLGEYRITEINIPDGYMLHEDTDNPQTTTLETDGDVDEVMFTNVREDDTPPPPELGEIEVTKVVQNRFGNGISSSTRFYFELQMFNDDEEWEVKEEKSILGNGTVTFDDLEDGLYRVREVRINSDFRLFSDNNLEVEVEDASSEEVEFINRLRPPQDDEDDDRPPRPRPEPEEEPEPEVESEVVIPEPVPEAPPVIVEEPEVEVVEEVTPLATLPRTGASDPAVFAGFGAAFMALGLFLKKKRF